MPNREKLYFFKIKGTNVVITQRGMTERIARKKVQKLIVRTR